MRGFCRRGGREGKGYCGKQPGPQRKGRWTSGKPGVGRPYNRSTEKGWAQWAGEQWIRCSGGEYNRIVAAPVELGPGLAAVPGPSGGSQTMGTGGGPRAEWVEGRGPPQEMQCCSPQYRWDRKRQRPEGRDHQCTAQHRNQIWPEIFLNCSTAGQRSNGAGHRKRTNRGSLNTGQG